MCAEMNTVKGSSSLSLSFLSLRYLFNFHTKEGTHRHTGLCLCVSAIAD